MIIRSWHCLIPYASHLFDIDCNCFGKSHWNRDTWKRLYAHQGLAVILAFHKAKPIAFTASTTIPPEAEILKIAVSHPYRRQAIGKGLISRIIADLTELSGIDRVHLEVRSDNLGAINLYKSQMFTISGMRKNYYPDPAADAIIFTRELRSR